MSENTKKSRTGVLGKRLFLKLTILLTALAGGWTIYLDLLIQEKFEGRRWELPAHVYSAPDILFSGARISVYQLEQQLRNLGYTEASSITKSGEFHRKGDHLDFFSRRFYFFNGVRQGKPVRVNFAGTSVKTITDIKTGLPLNTYRLEPLLMGAIFPDSREDRILVRLGDVPPIIIKALTASEDRNFFSHHGISLKAIARAIWVKVTAGGRLQGGSTLTQQLVKNYFLTAERTLFRKIKEAVMSLLLERHYDKSEILEAYINEVYLGQDGSRSINGFGLAGFFYFSKPLSELTISQAATLVALVRGPSVYNPFRFPERLKARRNLILGHLLKRGDISPKIHRVEVAAPLLVNRRGKHHENLYPSFLGLVKHQLKREYRSQDLQTEGLRIFTTLVPRIQTIAEINVKKKLEELENGLTIEKGKLQAAVIVTNPDNGEVSALIGDRHLRQEGFNRALNAFRPVGSLIKPLIYLTALEKPEYHLGTLLSDEPFELTDENGLIWQPQNFDKVSRGTVLLLNGLAESNNLASVRLGMKLSLGEINKTLQRLAVKERMNYPSALLGAFEMTPVQVAELYQHFASGGFSTPLQSIVAVVDNQNRELKRYPLVVNQVVDSASIFQLNFALQYATFEGTSKSISKQMPEISAAGKTGTTDNLRDSWFAGFTGDRMGVVWVGMDDNSSTGLTGASGAMQIWIDIMKNISDLGFNPPLPENMTMINVTTSGQLTEESCAGVVQIPLRSEFIPEKLAGCKKRASKLLHWIRGVFK